MNVKLNECRAVRYERPLGGYKEEFLRQSQRSTQFIGCTPTIACFIPSEVGAVPENENEFWCKNDQSRTSEDRKAHCGTVVDNHNLALRLVGVDVTRWGYAPKLSHQLTREDIPDNSFVTGLNDHKADSTKLRSEVDFIGTELAGAVKNGQSWIGFIT